MRKRRGSGHSIQTACTSLQLLLLLMLPLLLQEYEYYINNYPVQGEKVLGFLDFNLLLGLQLDHIYTAWYFYGSIALLAASLMACTYSTQWPTAKVRAAANYNKQPMQQHRKISRESVLRIPTDRAWGA